jgi:hypothetical protein
MVDMTRVLHDATLKNVIYMGFILICVFLCIFLGPDLAFLFQEVWQEEILVSGNSWSSLEPYIHLERNLHAFGHMRTQMFM